MNRLLYNGRTGGLGRFFSGTALTSRLEDLPSLIKELEQIKVRPGDRFTLLPLAV